MSKIVIRFVQEFKTNNIMKTNFTKEDLRNGDKVITRDGRIWLVIKDCNTLHYGRQSFILLDLQVNYGFMVSDSYDMGLMDCYGSETDRGFDIIKVYRDGDEGMSGLSIRNDVHSYDLIWSRE